MQKIAADERITLKYTSADNILFFKIKKVISPFLRALISNNKVHGKTSKK